MSSRANTRIAPGMRKAGGMTGSNGCGGFGIVVCKLVVCKQGDHFLLYCWDDWYRPERMPGRPV